MYQAGAGATAQLADLSEANAADAVIAMQLYQQCNATVPAALNGCCQASRIDKLEALLTQLDDRADEMDPLTTKQVPLSPCCHHQSGCTQISIQIAASSAAANEVQLGKLQLFQS